jgi:hypothetical protein
MYIAVSQIQKLLNIVENTEEMIGSHIS